MLYCFVNNVYVNYADLLWKGLHYSLEHPSTLIPYPKFINLIISHYMTTYPEISRRVGDNIIILEHDEMVKSIFNSGKNKAGVEMKITSWMITDEIKLIENYRIVRIPLRRSTRLTPPTPILTAAEVEDISLRNTIQLSIAEQKICDELEAKQNVEKTADAQPVNVIEEEDGSADDDYELRRMEKGKNIEETRNTPSPIIILEY
ncbi:hypothetical protein Tco_1307512 [Tanacetum coccineum]